MGSSIACLFAILTFNSNTILAVYQWRYQTNHSIPSIFISFYFIVLYTSVNSYFWYRRFLLNFSTKLFSRPISRLESRIKWRDSTLASSEKCSAIGRKTQRNPHKHKNREEIKRKRWTSQFLLTSIRVIHNNIQDDFITFPALTKTQAHASTCSTQNALSIWNNKPCTAYLTTLKSPNKHLKSLYSVFLIRC